ncbi:MAG: hypothetical protein ABI871_03565 [Chthoniobacterales bacterium]
MRSLGLICLLFLSIRIANAQEQESKLLNRLLKPNTTLGNSAQNKRFVADGASVDKKATTSEFHGARTAAAKTFADQREFYGAAFAARHFRDGDSAASVATRGAIPNVKLAYATTTLGSVRAAADATKGATTSQYSGQRPFLGQGKSQKALHAQDKPLTIEQVRELLNKNK